MFNQSELNVMQTLIEAAEITLKLQVPLDSWDSSDKFYGNGFISDFEKYSSNHLVLWFSEINDSSDMIYFHDRKYCAAFALHSSLANVSEGVIVADVIPR